MTFQIKTTDQIDISDGIKVMVYGKAGAGKTRLCATAPQPLILSAEAGLLSLRKYSIPYIEVKTVTDLQQILAWLSTDPNAKATYRTICLDSISEIAEVVLANAKAQVKDPRQAYGELLEKMIMTLKAYRDLKGFDVVFLAKQEKVKDEHTGVMMYGPMLPGSKVGQNTPYLVDEVFQLTKGKNTDNSEYDYLLTRSTFDAEAKDRSGALDPIEYPDLTNIFNKIRLA